MGQSLSKVLRENPHAAHVNSLSKIYEYRNYILVPNIKSKNMHVLIKYEANVEDVLCAYLHATLLAMITCAINDEPLVSCTTFFFSFVTGSCFDTVPLLVNECVEKKRLLSTTMHVSATIFVFARKCRFLHNHFFRCFNHV